MQVHAAPQGQGRYAAEYKGSGQAEVPGRIISAAFPGARGGGRRVRVWVQPRSPARAVPLPAPLPVVPLPAPPAPLPVVP